MTRLRNLHTSLLDVATEIMMATERQAKGPKLSGQVVVTMAFPGDDINRDIVVTYTNGLIPPHRRMVLAWGHRGSGQASSMIHDERDNRTEVRGRAGPLAGNITGNTVSTSNTADRGGVQS